MENNDIYWEYHKGSKDLPCVVFFHGDLQNRTSFKKIAKEFHNKGHSILLFDLPGHGLNLQQTSSSLEFVNQFISNHSLERPILIGHSSGGILATEYALATQNASSLILINCSITNPSLLSKVILEHIDDYVNISRNLFKEQELFDYSTKEMTSEEIVQAGFSTTSTPGFKNLVDYYIQLEFNPKILTSELPFLIINSSNEKFIPIEKVRELAGKMKNTKFLEIAEDHNIIIKNPLAIEKIISENYDFIINKKHDMQQKDLF